MGRRRNTTTTGATPAGERTGDSSRDHGGDNIDQRTRGRHQGVTGSSIQDQTDRYEASLRDYTVAAHHDKAREKFGGFNWGACFFGWLVAIGVSILTSSTIGAIAAGIGSSADITQSDAQRQVGTISVIAAFVLLAILLLGYYAGGYVAGRMSRFDGGRQGLGVWVIGLVVTIVAAALGLLFGHQYNVLNRVDLPNIPVAEDRIGLGAIITAAAILVGTLLAALLGGKVGHRYHNRVDRVVGSGR